MNSSFLLFLSKKDECLIHSHLLIDLSNALVFSNLVIFHRNLLPFYRYSTLNSLLFSVFEAEYFLLFSLTPGADTFYQSIDFIEKDLSRIITLVPIYNFLFVTKMNLQNILNTEDNHLPQIDQLLHGISCMLLSHDS